MQPNDVLDLHLTHLVGWVVQTVGKALLVGAAIGILFGIWGALAESSGLISLGIGLGGLATAVYLASAQAPMPIEVDED